MSSGRHQGLADGLRRRMRRLKTLPTLPTLLTAGNLACGITAILCAAHYDPRTHPDFLAWGAMLIFAAMVFDMLDGKVARMTRTDGPFGAELDSLSDVVSFGVAPAMLVHRCVLEQSGVFGPGEKLLWFLTVFYPVMAAIRLARYNVEAGGGPTSHFRGIPSPGAAAVVCGWILLYRYEHPWLLEWGLATSAPFSGLLDLDRYRLGMLVIMTGAALIMVSTVPYPHLGNTLFGRMSFAKIIIILASAALLVMYPWWTLFAVTTLYLLWGVGYGLYAMVRNAVRGRAPLHDVED